MQTVIWVMANENMVNIPLSSDEENFAKNSNINSTLQNKPELLNGVGKLYSIPNSFV